MVIRRAVRWKMKNLIPKNHQTGMSRIAIHKSSVMDVVMKGMNRRLFLSVILDISLSGFYGYLHYCINRVYAI